MTYERSVTGTQNNQETAAEIPAIFLLWEADDIRDLTRRILSGQVLAQMYNRLLKTRKPFQPGNLDRVAYIVDAVKRSPMIDNPNIKELVQNYEDEIRHMRVLEEEFDAIPRRITPETTVGEVPHHNEARAGAEDPNNNDKTRKEELLQPGTPVPLDPEEDKTAAMAEEAMAQIIKQHR